MVSISSGRKFETGGQVLIEHGWKVIRQSFLICAIIVISQSALAHAKVEKVVVEKSTATLRLIENGRTIREYQVAFGANSIGHKVKEGDERTPEGTYTIDYKKQNSSYYRALHISYPNMEDRKHAERLGVSPGGQIMIHGQRNGFGWLAPIVQKFNWTDGCIALTNREMDEIWALIEIGIPIEIRP